MPERLIIKTSEIESIGVVEKTLEDFKCKDIDKVCQSQKLRVSFKAEKLGEEILVTGIISGDLALECFSCTREYHHPVNIKFVQSFPSNIEEIDLGEEIREELILNFPDKPQCSENCKGICFKCGRDLNVTNCGCKIEDSFPKLGELKKLLKKSNGGKNAKSKKKTYQVQEGFSQSG